MFVVIRGKKIIVGILLFFLMSVSFFVFLKDPVVTTLVTADNEELKEQVSQTLKSIFETRNQAILASDLNAIKMLYDTSTKYGTWAYEHQVKKTNYLHNWAEKQGVQFIDIGTVIKLRGIKDHGNTISINFSAITQYTYVYDNLREKENISRIGTGHTMNIKVIDGDYKVSKEWYTDPFADSMHEIDFENNKTFILEQDSKDFSNLNQRRVDAVEYADKYCGAGDQTEYFFMYNKKYRNYNPLGGDCANFASQILYEGGKFRKTGAWNYNKTGSRAWLNAQGFKDYMLYSGRASLIAHGSYERVLKQSYKLLPGDFVAYHKKGKVARLLS